MDRKETAEKLKKIALEAQWASERVKAIETLSEMKNEGIDALTEVSSKGKYSDERELALDSVKKIMKQKKEDVS